MYNKKGGIIVKKIRKWFSVVLAMALLCALVPPVVLAADAPEAAHAVILGSCIYIRADESVVGVSPDFYAEIAVNGKSTRLDAEQVQVFTETGVEVVLETDTQRNMSVRLHGLQRADGSVDDLVVSDKAFIFNPTAFSSYGWKMIEYDTFTVNAYDGDRDAVFTSVGSEWKLDFLFKKGMDDPYLLRHIELAADGIELQKQGDAYVFTAVGDGYVSLLFCGIQCSKELVHVREKGEIKRTLLPSVFVNSAAFGLAFGYWLGPVALVAALPVGLVFGVVKVIRILTA